VNGILINCRPVQYPRDLRIPGTAPLLRAYFIVL
jgi:hypothetical protein